MPGEVQRGLPDAAGAPALRRTENQEPRTNNGIPASQAGGGAGGDLVRAPACPAVPGKDVPSCASGHGGERNARGGRGIDDPFEPYSADLTLIAHGKDLDQLLAEAGGETLRRVADGRSHRRYQ